jgi:phage-related tail fiber protein
MWVAVIIVGTAIGGLIAYFAVRWYETRQLEAAMQQFARTVSGVSVQTQRALQAAQERARREAIAARERTETERAEQLVAQRRAIESENARIAAANAEELRRERAWAKFYVPSAQCKDPDNRATMQCANEYARAKKEFERRWAAGQI